jgi:hypothetical protein
MGRILLITGLPAGLGASCVALALADALSGMDRGVVLAASLAGLGNPPLSSLPARPLGPAWLLPQETGPDFLPLELCEEQTLPMLLPLLARETDFILVDRFTGLFVKDNAWYRAADEILLLVDGRAGMDTRSLLLAGHIQRNWPRKILHVLHTRMSGPFNWQTQAARFLRRLERQPGMTARELGCLPEAPEIQRAREAGRPFTRMYPNHPASRQLRQSARHLLRLADQTAAEPARGQVETLPLANVSRGLARQPLGEVRG